ncbi:MAG: Sjogren's syndrome/scleroderma autoantigen 1 family protein [Candidatus Bathyarchaeia archaeon]|jgi:UPF0148 protein
MSNDSENIKVMADLLRQGATLTRYACPACSSPIFKLKSGDMWCSKCQKRVIIVKEGDPEPEVNKKPAFSNLEATLLKKIDELETRLSQETDPEKLTTLGTTLSALLENLDKIRNMKK